MKVELLSLVAVARECLEVYPSLVQSWQHVSPRHSYKNHSAKRTQILAWLSDTGFELLMCSQPPIMC